MFEGYPSTLNKRTETPCKEGDVLIGDMTLDCLERVAGATIVIEFSRVGHGGVVPSWSQGLVTFALTMNAHKAGCLHALGLPQDLDDEVTFQRAPRRQVSLIFYDRTAPTPFPSSLCGPLPNSNHRPSKKSMKPSRDTSLQHI